LLSAFIGLAATPWALGHRSAEAHHPYGTFAPQNHQAHIHYASSGHGSWDEDYCAESHSSSVTDSGALTHVRNTLVADAGNHWDSTGNWNIDLWQNTTPCDSLTTSEEAAIEIQFHVYDSGGSGIQSRTDLQFGHYYHHSVRLQASHITGSTGSRRGTISHESGHVFGLRDPLGTTQATSDCEPADPRSVMHQFSTYGCQAWNYIEFPTYFDEATVVNEVMDWDYE
jgi:hypothetical protein